MISTTNALIGHTGFVGSHLREALPFEAQYNSRNIGDIRGRQFDTVVCAGVSAVKWLANKEPEKDRAGIEGLMRELETVTARRFVLISTVDVYAQPLGVTEADAADSTQPYGKHRAELEAWIAEKFADHVVVRLPALFGKGLKKNVIFDLMNDNLVSQINPNTFFQWYDLARFPGDLTRILESGLKLLNIAVEPVHTQAIVDRFFPGTALGAPSADPIRYDMRTRHSDVLGSTGSYHVAQDEVFADLQTFLNGPKA